ncbi:MAG: SDR family NAD(P)-dependent oxidoreductase [Ferrovibrio sp.]|uniref:SDR family NAD(P)-dependent oxidoreductase n=1 Tax=Ferrovibrio sp. TaxID=1917215 RepID=UPI00391CD088
MTVAAAIAAPQPMSFDLKGRHAVVIGGGSGIGRAIAEGLGIAGARLTLAGRRREVLEAAAVDFAKRGIAAGVDAVDASDTDQLSAFAARAEKAAPVDILVNAQGVMTLKAAEDFTPEDFDRIMTTNAKSVYFSCLAFGRIMLGRGRGSIVNIASLASFRGFPRNAIYCISKHGVVALTETLAAEWAARGVRVNAIAPGFFVTDLNRETLVDERRAKAIGRTPMGRLGETSELAGAAVFLSSPAASYVTGATIPVDGGFLAAGM